MMLRSIKLGLAGGIIGGVSLFLFTIISIYTGYAKPFLMIVSSVYPGYTISWWGSLIGCIYAFLDVFIGLAVFAWLYNAFIKIDKKKSSHSK